MISDDLDELSRFIMEDVSRKCDQFWKQCRWIPRTDHWAKESIVFETSDFQRGAGTMAACETDHGLPSGCATYSSSG